MSVNVLSENIRILGHSCLAPSGNNEFGTPRTGSIPAIKLRGHIPDRKSIKLMTRSVQLGVAAVSMAVRSVQNWDDFPPERRGFFVAASPQLGDPSDISPALDAATKNGQFSITDFGKHGMGLIHPLWLVRGLSNNVLGFASLFFDMQGINMNYCNGPDGGMSALVEGVHALLEDRADIVVAGGADCLIGGESLAGEACSEGAAFVVMTRGYVSVPLQISNDSLRPYFKGLGALGAAQWPVALVRRMISSE